MHDLIGRVLRGVIGDALAINRWRRHPDRDNVMRLTGQSAAKSIECLTGLRLFSDNTTDKIYTTLSRASRGYGP